MLKLSIFINFDCKIFENDIFYTQKPNTNSQNQKTTTSAVTPISRTKLKTFNVLFPHLNHIYVTYIYY